MTFQETYHALIVRLLDDAVSEVNARTNHTIRALPGGVSFEIDLSYCLLPVCGQRKTWPHVSAAELAWCLQGHNHIDWLRRHTKVWDDFADVTPCAECGGDGMTSPVDDDASSSCRNCGGTGRTYWLEAAYGNRWRNTFGRDQLECGINALRRDPSNRRVWISSWDPSEDRFDDSETGIKQKTVPCPVGFTLSVMENKLNSSFMIRSSDVFMGLPHDVMRHSLLMAAVAQDLDVGLGIMRVNLAHPHLYDSHWTMAANMLEQPIIEPGIILPPIGTKWIENNPDKYVETMKECAKYAQWPAYAPKCEVIK